MVYLIAGHRGAMTGANGYMDEGAEAVALRNVLTAALMERGVEVVVDDDEVALSQVVDDINRRCDEGDLIVDLHFNAFDGRVSGSEVLVSEGAGDGVRRVAQCVLAAVCGALGTRSRGVKCSGSGRHGRLAILDDTRCGAVLVEVCFCDNAGDVERYRVGRERLVEGLADVIGGLV